MRQKSGMFAVAAACILLCPALAQAQVNSVRGPVNAPVRLEIRDKAPASPANDPAGSPAKAPAQGNETRPAKFPNIDTAKNRQDYDLATPKSEGVRLGRDGATGDTVMGSTPKKKKSEADPFTAKPIEVRPIIPVLP
ncbi:MAG: hypothetical protein AB9900_04640 [Humidesulfovibrio sp.]